MLQQMHHPAACLRVWQTLSPNNNKPPNVNKHTAWTQGIIYANNHTQLYLELPGPSNMSKVPGGSIMSSSCLAIGQPTFS